jgi:hypothetical protein
VPFREVRRKKEYSTLIFCVEPGKVSDKQGSAGREFFQELGSGI